MTVGLISLSATGVPFGRVVLNMNEPAYYNNFLPWLDLWKVSEYGIQFFNASNAIIFNTAVAPGGNTNGASSYGATTNNNGELVDMSVNAPTVSYFQKGVYQAGSYIVGGFGGTITVPPQLASPPSPGTWTLMWTGGIGWTGSVNNVPGNPSKTATTSSTSMTFTFPATASNGTVMFVQFNINTGSLASPPQNIHVIPTAYVSTFNPAVASTMIDPNYISFLSSTAGILRAMPMQSTNVNFVTTSIDTMPSVASLDWSFGVSDLYQGCPLDVLAYLAKASNKHLWFNIPAFFIGPKVQLFNNTSTNPANPALGAFTPSNPAVYQPNKNQPFANGDTVIPWDLNVNFQGGTWCRVVKCQGLSSSVFSLANHNFANGQLIRLGCDINGNSDNSTYPTGISKTTFYYVCNVVANTSFQLAAIAAPSTPLTLTGTMKGPVNNFGTITGGSSYTNGTYTNVPMTGGTGTSCTATVIVSGGAVTSVIPNYTINGSRMPVGSGTGYTIGDSLSALAANIGGTGSGFSVAVGCVDINVQQCMGFGNSFTVASSATKSFSFSGPGSDTSFYGCGLATPTVNVGASSFGTTSQIVNGLQVVVGTLDGVFADQSTYPTGITKGQIYFIVNVSGSTFQLSTTFQGSPISLSGSSTGALNFYAVLNASSGSVMSTFNLSYLQTQISRVASYFQTAFAGTSIRVYYELGNEIWGGSTPGTAVGNAQALGLGLGVFNGYQANGYMMSAIADQLYTSYGGDKTKYRMLNSGANLSSTAEINSVISGMNSYIAAVSSSRTINQLFDHPIVTNYYGFSYAPNGSSATPTFTNGSPGTVAISGGTTAKVGMPFKFHATAGSLPTGLSENTTYWLAGTSPNFNLTASPGGSNINLSGTLGTYTCYYARGDVVGELLNQSILLGPGPAGNGTNPTKYDYFAQALRDDVKSGKWTFLAASGSIPPNGPQFGIDDTANTLAIFAAAYLGLGQTFAGQTVLPYEGGDNNNNNLSFWPESTGASFVGTISNGSGGAGTLLNVSSGPTLQIGMDITTGATAGTLITGVRNDLGAGNYTVNISQNTTPTAWASNTMRSFYYNTMYHNTYAQAFVDEYTANGAAMSGYIAQFLDCNPVAYGDGNGTYGMCQFIGDNNPRLTWVQYVNNLP